MPNDFSFDAYIKFLDFVAEKALMKQNTAGGFKAAANKAAPYLTDAEKADVRRIDVDQVFAKVVNRDGSSLAPRSLKEYKRRLTIGIAEFVSWSKAPDAYKAYGTASPKARGDGKGTAKSRKRGTAKAKSPESGGGPPSPAADPAQGDLSLPFPLRPEFTAYVTLPRDLTSLEARRLGAFIGTLAIDYEPTK